MVPYRNAEGPACGTEQAWSVWSQWLGDSKAKAGEGDTAGQAEPRPELGRLRVHPRQKTLSGEASGVLLRTLTKKAD